MSALSDWALVVQVSVFKNKRAYGVLVEKYQSQIRRFFLHQTCGDEQLSDDLAQETFIKAYTNISSFKNMSTFATWIYRIANNVFYDYTRSKKSYSELDEREVDAVNNVEQADLSKKMDINNALAQLKENERSCITLFYMEDMSIEDISEALSIPQGSVKSYLSRGKEKMAKYLRSNGYE